MNISKINLNLLIALDALLSEQHVTRAGEKIFITQSAMSSALTQCRELFKDPLLIRDGKNMKPTPRALALAPKIRQLLQEIEQTITPTTFDPKTATNTFRIGMSDYIEFVLLPKLLPLLNKQAPNINLRITHLNALDKKEPFEAQQLDLGIGVSFAKIPDSLETELLFTDGSACVARANHPLMQKKLTLKNYLAAKHITIMLPDDPYQTCIDRALEKIGHKRKSVITVPHMLPALFATANTPYIVTTTIILANTLAKALKLAIKKPPFPTETVEIKQAWQKHFTADPAHTWLRQLIKQAASELIS
jgi:LysR family transcriptional activator of mexEF-oprN operon